ncbi:MAG: hypothetical protein SCH39_11035 [Methanosarcinales archaeon]|nr:hypothetical protein [Methanosarcinales archaeon]
MQKQEEVNIPPKANEITLADLISAGGPLLKQYTDSENEIHRMELEFEYKIRNYSAPISPIPLLKPKNPHMMTSLLIYN